MPGCGFFLGLSGLIIVFAAVFFIGLFVLIGFGAVLVLIGPILLLLSFFVIRWLWDLFW